MPRNPSSNELRINVDILECDSTPLLEMFNTKTTLPSRRASPGQCWWKRRSGKGLRRVPYSADDIENIEVELAEESWNAAPPSAHSPHAVSMPCVRSSLPDEIPSFSPLLYNQHYRSSGGSIWSTAFNLASSSLGAGTLALPHAMYTSGLGLGTLLLGFTCWCTIYSVYLLGLVQEESGLSSIEELVHVFISPGAAKLTAALILIFCWGAAVMYVVLMGDFIAPVITFLQPVVHLQRHQAMILFWGIIMFPLSLLRDVTSLQYTSILGTVSTLFLAISLFVKLKDTPPEERYYGVVHFDQNVIGAVATFIFSYCCQPIVITAYREMREKSVRKLTLSASYSMAVCTIIYLASGMCGAIAYGNAVEPNVLINFQTQLDVPYVLLSYIAMVCSVTLAFPMAIFPSRSSTLLLLGYSDSANVPTWLMRATGGALALLALLLGFFFPSVRALFDILGGICGGTISFLLPGVLAVRCHEFYPLQRHQLIMSRILVLLGGIMTLLGSYHTYQSIFYTDKLSLSVGTEKEMRHKN